MSNQRDQEKHDLTHDQLLSYSNQITAGVGFALFGLVFLVYGFSVGLTPPIPDAPPNTIVMTQEMARAIIVGGVIGGVGWVAFIPGIQLLYEAGLYRERCTKTNAREV